MKLHLSYVLTFLSRLPQDFKIPLRFQMDGKVFEISDVDEEQEHASAFVESSVDTTRLIIRTNPEDRVKNGLPSKIIEVPEKDALAQFLIQIVNMLSFILDVPIRYNKELSDYLITETTQDQKALETLGADQIYSETSVSFVVRSFSLKQVSDRELMIFAEKEIGLALFNQAKLVQQPVATFREYWRVLESAFGAKDEKLVSLLNQYPPTKLLDFSQDELKKILIIRGRASHAESRSGIKEYEYVTKETSKLLPRLKCLVEQVILTKKVWGAVSLETERIAKLDTFIDSDGNPNLIKYSD